MVTPAVISKDCCYAWTQADLGSYPAPATYWSHLTYNVATVLRLFRKAVKEYKPEEVGGIKIQAAFWFPMHALTPKFTTVSTVGACHWYFRHTYFVALTLSECHKDAEQTYGIMKIAAVYQALVIRQAADIVNPHKPW